MAKKMQTDTHFSSDEHQQQSHGNSNSHPNSLHPSISSGNSQNNKIQVDTIPNSRQSIDYIPPEISYETHHDFDDNEHAGEQMIYIEKHVEFTDDFNENEEEKEPSQQQKLHRRDTPHHLKNKRILNKTNDSIAIDQIMSHSPTKSSITSGRKESNSTIHTRSSNVHQQQLTVTIHRSSNIGLGISIAGGIGSTPYKDNDYGIFLTKITDNGPAEQAGLRVADKVLSVNGISLIDCEHSQAVSALKQAGDTIEMMISREIIDDNSNKIENILCKQNETYSTLMQHQNEQIDSTIIDNQSSLSINNNKNNNQTLTIDDRIQSMNGHHTSNNNHDKSSPMIHTETNNVQLTVSKEKTNNENTAIIDHTIEEARIIKGNGPMGLSIVGGIDQACPPFGISQRGVFVSKILPNGSASRTNLRIGDRILKVNNNDISQSTHLQAVQALVHPSNEVVLLVRHEPQPAGLKEIILTKQLNEPVGIRINGGIDGKRVNPDDPDDDGIFVTEVKENTPASGILAVGTRILEVNNQSLFGARLDDAQKWLSTPSDTLHLLICHGFKPKQVVSVNSSMSPIENQTKSNEILATNQLFISSTKSNGISSKSIQPPPVPVKPKFRQTNNFSASVNGENQTNTIQPSQNGFELDQLDSSTTESKRSFKDKKKFFESGIQDSRPKAKPRQFKYINEHELVKMKQEDEQKLKTMNSIQQLQSHTHFGPEKADSELIETTLSQCQTPTYLAEPEDDDDDDDNLISPRSDRSVSSAASRVRYDIMGVNKTQSDLV